MSLHSSILKKLSGVKAEPYHFPDKDELLAEQDENNNEAEQPEQEQDDASFQGERKDRQDAHRFEDVFDYSSVQTEAILEDARKQAEQIKTNAYIAIQPELNSIRDAAREEGYRDGFSKGMAQAAETYQKEREQQSAALAKEVKSFLDKASEAQIDVIDQTKDDMRDLAVAVAEKVIQVSLQSSSGVIAKMIQRATERLKRREWVHIYIGGCDTKEISQMTPQLMTALSTLSDHIRVTPVSDEERGTCIIEMPDTIIDASVSTQMENIRAVFSDIPVEDQQPPLFSSTRYR